MLSEQTFEALGVEALLERVAALHQQKYRLVQIGATRLAHHLELTYSFDLDGRLLNLRLKLAGAQPHVPSISSLYWCAFLYENELHDLFHLQVEGMAVDFQGNLYKTAIQFPFGSTKAPEVKASAAPPAPTVSPTPAPVPTPPPAQTPASTPLTPV